MKNEEIYGLTPFLVQAVLVLERSRRQLLRQPSPQANRDILRCNS
jgi:hypothetical protein